MNTTKNGRGGRPNNNSDPHEPAYEGAKFDVSGHCLKHPHIRMCKPKEILKKSSKKKKDDAFNQPEYKYVIVRKTCHLCGEHALRNERKLNKKSWLHGYDPVKIEVRKVNRNVGTDVHTKMNTGHGTRTTKRSGGRHTKVPPGSPTRVLDSTPPTSPESDSPVRNIKFKMIESASPPPLPTERETRRTERRRLHGAVPAGPTFDIRLCSRSRGKSQPRSSRRGHDTKSEDDNSGGSRTTRTTRTERRSNKKRSQSVPRTPVSMLKRLDHLRV